MFVLKKMGMRELINLHNKEREKKRIKSRVRYLMTKTAKVEYLPQIISL